MKQMKKILAVLLCIVLVVSGLIYRHNQKIKDADTLIQSELSESVEDPAINITVVDEKDITPTPQIEKVEEQIDRGEIEDVEGIVYSSVQVALEKQGFTTNVGYAQTIEDNSYTATGLYYYDDGLELIGGDSGIKSVGFVEIAEETEQFHKPNDSSVVAVTPIDPDYNDDVDLLCIYNYQSIGSDHFVYQNKYITYYQQTDMRVVYSVKENDISQYDFALGSIFDYDHHRYIYDSTLDDQYIFHSGEKLFSDTDYAELEVALKELSEAQYEAGFLVSEYNIVYISPESIQAYLDSEEKDTFFGYSVDELTETLGIGTALEYTENGLEPANIVQESEHGYNWKSFLTKVGLGCGIILVGAILTPITGGASFGCALLTISKVAVSYALCTGLGALTIETAKGIANGKSPVDALKDASYKGLDAFANGFMIGAVIGSVGVVSGLIKPIACFAAGTPVIVADTEGNLIYKNIEDIVVGDKVFAYDETNGITSVEIVRKIYHNKSACITTININGENLFTTPNHPFYDPNVRGWRRASSIRKGSIVQSYDRGNLTIADTRTVTYANAVDVYNLEVENLHTYYVGISGLLVHNECHTIGSMQNKAVREAWKKEVEAVKNGTSKYNWTTKEIKQLLKNGKVKGYQGHHIRTVKELAHTVDEKLIENADNIVFIAKDSHKYIHALGDTFAATSERLVEVVPWIAERYELLGIVA